MTLSIGLWILEVGGASFIGAVSPWRALLLVPVGLLLTFYRSMHPVMCVGLLSAALLPVVQPALLAPSGWILVIPAVLLAVVGLQIREYRRLRIAMGLGVVALGCLEALRQCGLIGMLESAWTPVFALVLFPFVLGCFCMAPVPSRRLGVLLLLGFGWLVFSDGRLGHRIQTMPFEEAVVEVVDRQAWSHWPVVEERVLSMLAREEIDAVSHAKRVIHARPTRHPVGLALVKAGGSAHAVEAGFNPSGIIDSTLAVDLALELENAGNLGRAIALLRRHPRTGRLAFVLSYLAAAHGDDALCESAWRKGKVGGGVPLLPGSLVGPTHLYSGEPNEVLFVAEERLNELEIRAEGRSHLGQPELSLELDGRQVWGPQAVPSKGSVWVWKVAISPGAHRLSARLTNDLTGSGGDRNIHGLEIWAR